jgi:pimeloyl-ACP methyl ester carboxylesterase/DNA-binding CsgD family transcriptional regulator
LETRSGSAYSGRVPPATKYAKSGDVSVAYQVVGDGPPDLVLVPGFVSHVEAAWEWPYLARFLHRLASVARLIVFDKRGTGLSDPMTRPPTMEERMDDIRAVMEATGCERATLLGISEGGALSVLFASVHPGRVSSLVLYGSYAKKLATPDYPWGVSEERLALFQESFDEAWATGRWWDIVNPDVKDDPASREWWARYLRVSASPGMAKQLMAINAQIDIRAVLPELDVPTLVIHRRDDRWVDLGNATYLSEKIPGARLVELEGSDHRPWLEDADAVLEEMESFVTGGRPRPRHARAKLGAGALSRREREIVQLATHGQSTPEIARGLFLSERTVESHLANAYVKLGVHSRIELVRRAAELDV